MKNNTKDGDLTYKYSNINKYGELAKLAATFKCNINLSTNGKTASAKSILGIMSLGIKAKTEIEIECDGEDEQTAMEEILKGFENKFGE